MYMEHSNGRYVILKKLVVNSGWIMYQNIFTMVLGVVVAAITARYLGPSNFGQFNYAVSFITLFTAFSTLGMQTLIVKDIVERPDKEWDILWTSFLIRVFGGVILTVLSNAIIHMIEPKDVNLQLMVLILSLNMIFKAFEVIEYWIQATLQSKISSLIRSITYVVTSLLKILVVVIKGSIVTYTLVYSFDVIIIGFALVAAYTMKRDITVRWKVNYKYAREVLSKCWYLAVSGVMITIYIRIDQVMLGSMMSNKTELGIYSAAVRIAEMWYFVPMAVITSFQSIIMKYKTTDKHKYKQSIESLFTIVVWVGIIFGLLITLLSEVIVSTLYGPEYFKAASILSISVWAGIFATVGSARSVWLVCENLQQYTMAYATTGVIINISLNLVLIPDLGSYGAAISTLIAQFISNVIILSFFKKTRPSSRMIIRAFSLLVVLEYFKKKRTLIRENDGIDYR